MSSRKNPESDPLNNWEGFYEELQDETPRAAIILAGAFLDGLLSKLISTFLIADQKAVSELLGTDGGDAPLSSFSSKIKAAYCLGLISRDEYDDLNLIRKVRNKFAHEMHGFSITDQHVVNWCNELKIPQKTLRGLKDFPTTHAGKLLLGIALLASQIALRTLSTEKQASPRNFETQQSITAINQNHKTET